MRQVHEAVEISRGPPDALLNNKEEYNCCLLPVIHVEGPKSIKQQEAKSTPVEPISRLEEERALDKARKDLKLMRLEHNISSGRVVKRR